MDQESKEVILKLNEKLKQANIDCVCLKLIKNEEDIVDLKNIKKLETPLRHCQIVDQIRKTKESICTNIENHICKGGAAAIGFCELSNKIKSGMFYYNDLKHFKDLESAKKTIESISFLPPYSTKYAIYSTLENINFKPDIIMFLVNPKQAMLLTQSYIYNNGGSIISEFSGKQSFCSDGVAKVILSNKPNLTIGCSGSRKYTNIKDEELLISFPWNCITKIYQGLCNILN